MKEPGPRPHISRLITNREIGHNGRFGNQFFQYLFLAHHAATYGISFANTPWIGDKIFTIQPGQTDLPSQIRTLVENFDNPHKCPVRKIDQGLLDTEVSGYFQFSTGFYATQKDILLQHLRFRDGYRDYVQRLNEWLQGLPGTAVAIHIRRGDYGTGFFFRAPADWYRKWLVDLGQKIGAISLYVATDEPDSVLPEFSDFDPVFAGDAPKPQPEPGYFTDFAALTLASHVAISNSSFSFSATMLNATGQTFMRPSLIERKLIPYDPWDAPVLLKDITAEEAGEAFMSERAKSRSKYRLRKFLGLAR